MTYRLGALYAPRKAGIGAAQTMAVGGRGLGVALGVALGVREKEGVGVALAPGLGTTGSVVLTFCAALGEREEGALHSTSKAGVEMTPPP